MDPMNVLSNISQQLPEELNTVLQQGDGVRIERLVSTGHHSQDGFWYDQSEHEWVIVLQGIAKIECEDGLPLKTEGTTPPNQPVKSGPDGRQ